MPLIMPFQRPFVVYCHCNSGSRVESLKYANSILKNGFGLCCFDFSGSGISEGELVTLGYNEAEDLKTIIAMLKQLGVNEKIFLWGRSMGSATVLYYLLKNPHDPAISGVILDSPYSNLRNLALDLANESTKLPKFMLKPFINSIEKKIHEKVGLKFEDLDLLSLVKKKKNIETPAYFITSLKDKVVKASHVEDLYREWGKKAILKYIDLQHQEPRGEAIIENCLQFIRDNVEISMRRTKSFHIFNLNKEIFQQIPLEGAKKIKISKKQ